MIHNREADEETAAALEPFRRHGRPALLLVARAARDAAARARLLRVVRRERHLPEGGRAARRGGASFRWIGSSSRPTARTSPRSPSAGRPNEPANVVHTIARARRGARRGSLDELAAATARRTLRLPSACRDASRRRRRSASTSSSTRTSSASSGVSSELDPGDVVLEVGPGLGVLHTLPRRSRPLRPRDRVRPLARAARSAMRSGSGANVDLVWDDALDIDSRPARACADEARGEPSVQRRDAARRRDAGARARRSSAGA